MVSMELGHERVAFRAQSTIVGSKNHPNAEGRLENGAAPHMPQHDRRATLAMSADRERNLAPGGLPSAKTRNGPRRP